MNNQHKKRLQIIKSLLTIIFCSFFINTMFSQGYLKEIIDEMSDEKTDSIDLPTAVKSKLPSVINSIPENTFIGISDPIMNDSLMAKNQATTRAYMMYGLQNGSVKSMYDLFHDDMDGVKMANFEELNEFSISASLPINHFSFEYFYLDSGETIAVMTLNPRWLKKRTSVEINSSIVFYAKEVSSDDFYQSSSKLLVDNQIYQKQFYKSSELTMKENYSFMNDGYNRNYIQSNFNSKEINFSDYRFFYKTDEQAIQANENHKGKSLYHGLWYALLNDLFPQIMTKYTDERMQVKELTDTYQSTQKTIQRGVSNFPISIKIKSLIAKDDKLYVLIE